MDIRYILRKINNMLSRGKLLELNTKTKIPTAKAGLFAQEIWDGIEYAQDYGMKSYPPINSQIITAHFGGNRNHATIVKAFDKDSIPDDELEEGEVLYYSKFNATIKLDKDSNIVLKNESVTITISNEDGNVTIDAPLVTLTGDLLVDGTINGIPIP